MRSAFSSQNNFFIVERRGCNCERLCCERNWWNLNLCQLCFLTARALSTCLTMNIVHSFRNSNQFKFFFLVLFTSLYKEIGFADLSAMFTVKFVWTAVYVKTFFMLVDIFILLHGLWCRLSISSHIVLKKFFLKKFLNPTEHLMFYI